MDDPNDELSAPSGVTRGETPGVRANLTHQKPGQATTGSALDRVFIGPNGIRAGWRILLFLSIAVIVGLLLGQAIRALGIRAGAGFNPLTAILGEGIGLAAVLFSTAVMARIEKRSFTDYALPWRGAFGRGFGRGVVWGFVALTSLLLVLRVAHGFYFGSLALGGVTLVRYAGFWAVAFLAVGCLEEFLFRGYALYTLTTGIGFWPAAVLLSLVFGGIHLRNPGEDWMGALNAALIGLFFSFTVRRSGNVWFAVGLHSMWDYSESFLYSVPDSGAMVQGHLLNSSFHGPKWLTGGSVGPEGSVLAFVVIVAMFVVFDRLHREALFPRRAGTVQFSSRDVPGGVESPDQS